MECQGLAYHLNLVVAQAWPMKNELLLRHWLIGHEDVARYCEAFKLELTTADGDDMPRYIAGKAKFLRHAVNDARRSVELPIEQNWEE